MEWNAAVVQHRPMSVSQAQALREANIRQYGISGYIEPGNHTDYTDHKKIADGLTAVYSVSDNLMLGAGSSVTNRIGQGNEAVFNMNGIILHAEGINTSSVTSWRALLKQAPAPISKPETANISAACVKHDFVTVGNQSYICIQDAPLNTAVTDTNYFEPRDWVSRKDLVALEMFLVEIGTDAGQVQAVYPYGATQHGLTTFKGISLTGGVMPQSYSSFGDWDNTTTGNGVNWLTLSDAHKFTFYSDPRNNIYYDESTGKWYQWQYRFRSIRGLGNSWQQTKFTDDVNGFAVRYTGLDRVRVRGFGIDDTDFTVGREAFATARFAAGFTSATSMRTIALSDYTVFANRDTEATDRVIDNQCFLLPICEVTRRNQGMHHKFLNELGTRKSNRSDDANNADWHSSLITTPSSVADCFTNSTGSTNTAGYRVDTGYRSSNQSGKDDGTFYDVIYKADVKDLRFRCIDDPQSLDDRLHQYVSSAVIETENAPILRIEQLTTNSTGESAHSDFTRINFDSVSSLGVSYEWFSDPMIKTYIVLDDGLAYQVRSTNVTGLQVSFLEEYGDLRSQISASTTYYLISQTRSDVAFSTLSLTSIAATPAALLSIFSTYGIDKMLSAEWFPVIPNTTSQSYKFNRNTGLGTVNRQYTSDNGATWTNSPTSLINSANNTYTDVISPGAVFLLHYYAVADRLTPADQTLVSGKQLSSVFYCNRHQYQFGTDLVRELTGFVPVGTGVGIGITNLTTYSFGSLEDITSPGQGNAFPDVTHNSIELADPSHGVKCFLYEHVDEYGLIWDYIVFKQLKYDAGLDNVSDFTEIDGTTTVAVTEGNTYRITGLELDYVVYSNTSGNVIFSGLTPSNGEYLDQSGNSWFTQWDGDGFGDDGKFNIVNKITTTPDNNGNYIIVGCMKSKSPRGWRRPH